MLRVYQADAAGASLCEAKPGDPTPIVSTVSGAPTRGGLMLPIGLWYFYRFV
jgi:hypothetical protein